MNLASSASRNALQRLGFVCLCAAIAMGCGGSETQEACAVDTSYKPTIDPANFVTTIDHPLYPLIPGTVFTYQEGTNSVVVTVMPDTKVILGVTCVVVHDVVSDTASGAPIEDTFDWYAQDAQGNVWYMGENTKEFNSGGEVISTEGSWEAGVDGAQPGIIMLAAPAVGQQYKQEYYACHAEDQAEILEVNSSADVPNGMYTGCVTTHDYTPLDPDVNEQKTYCPGVGLVLGVDVPTGEREELLSVMP